MPSGESLNSVNSWAYDKWMQGEPSYSWGEIAENVVALYFDATIGEWVLNDIPEQGYPGNLYGYIIEY